VPAVLAWCAPLLPLTVVGTIKSAEARFPPQRRSPNIPNDNVDGYPLSFGILTART
jgi:hypothetical protein